jgi:hypothetical protein
MVNFLKNLFKEKEYEYHISFHYVNSTTSGFGNTSYFGVIKNCQKLREIEKLIALKLNNESTISIISFSRNFDK